MKYMNLNKIENKNESAMWFKAFQSWALDLDFSESARQGEFSKPCPPPTLNVQVSLATGFAAGVANGLTFQAKAAADASHILTYSNMPGLEIVNIADIGVDLGRYLKTNEPESLKMS